METLNLKYRPKSFSEVIGQNTIVSILSKQIATKTFKNTYLFCGPSGCGKTTLARIMAKKVNDGQGEPIEIDAATNNGIDTIRSLINDSQQASLDAEYKVYIIDEAQALTSAAWGSALKLIEEPPLHCIFIFCTTDPQKIPETILTRVQRFDFKRIKDEDIYNRIEFILNEEVVCNYEPEAIKLIAVNSKGYMREAISLLDKCLSYSKDLTLTNVEQVLGALNQVNLTSYLDALINNKTEEALNLIKQFKAFNSSSLKLLDDILGFFIKCAEVQKTGGRFFTCLRKETVDYVLALKQDLMFFVERALKYRIICTNDNADNLLDVLTMELLIKGND